MKFNKLIAPLALVSLTALSGSTLAADGHAYVTLLTPLTVGQDTAIDFTEITTENGTCTMDAGGNLAGTLGQTCTASDAIPGVFQIDGSDVAVSLAVGSGSVAGVTFNPTLPGGNSVTLSGGTANVTVLGNLVLNGATAGDKDITYTFTASYQ